MSEEGPETRDMAVVLELADEEHADACVYESDADLPLVTKALRSLNNKEWVICVPKAGSVALPLEEMPSEGGREAAIPHRTPNAINASAFYDQASVPNSLQSAFMMLSLYQIKFQPKIYLQGSLLS